MALTDNLQAFYKLSDLSDSSGYNRTLTNNGNVTFAPGKIGDAGVFDGSNSLSLNSLPNANSTESTITLWFKENLPTEDFACFYIAGGEAESQFAIIRVGGDIKGFFTNSGDGFFANGSNADDGNWHFAAMRFTPTTFKIWLDGSSNAQEGSFNAISSSPFLRIGSNWDGTYLSHNGPIDAVGIWNRALSDAEVAELYNNGTGLELNGVPQPTLVKLQAPVKFMGKVKFGV
jgi:arabinan endo-1,5-alpha-L-arabinosidase